MKISSLDLQGNLSLEPSAKDVEEYTKILENPDLLGRLFRQFAFKNLRKGLWDELFDRYLAENAWQGKSWITDRRTNLPRTLFRADTVTWRKFLEGLVVLSDAFDDMRLEIFTDLNDGRVTDLRIRKKTLQFDDIELEDLPKGELLIPRDFYRNPLEPLPLKVVRDTISPIGTSDEFRAIIRKNLAETMPSSKVNAAVNSRYVSVLRSKMTWKQMMSIVFSVGATIMVVKIRATKNGKTYTAMTKVKR